MTMENVLVISKETCDSLLNYNTGNFITIGYPEVLKAAKAGQYISRGLAEKDPSFKQMIPYGVIQNEDSFLLFLRTKKQTEKRLHNLYSLGIGGHINQIEKETASDPVIAGLNREIDEEIYLPKIQSVQFGGIINDNTNEVGSVHLGLLFFIRLENKSFEIREKEMMSGEWVLKKDLQSNIAQMETWSQIVTRDCIFA